jgi:hypothetical protein
LFFKRRLAVFAIVVVFPEPLIPKNNITNGSSFLDLIFSIKLIFSVIKRDSIDSFSSCFNVS